MNHLVHAFTGGNKREGEREIKTGKRKPENKVGPKSSPTGEVSDLKSVG
jgi:hypothetical protein